MRWRLCGGALFLCLILAAPGAGQDGESSFDVLTAYETTPSAPAEAAKAAPSPGNSAGVIEFRLSKPHSLWLFLREAATARDAAGKPPHPYAQAFLDSGYSADRRTEYFLKRFKETDMADPRWPQATALAADFEEFRSSYPGFSWIMGELEEMYDSLVWNKYSRAAQTGKETLSRLARESGAQAYAEKIARFYSAKAGLVVVITPLPDAGGEARPSVSGAVLSLPLNSDSAGPDKLVIIVHELCHVYYAAQPQDIRARLAEAGGGDAVIDESLAIAAETGWAQDPKELKKPPRAPQKADALAAKLSPALESYLKDAKPMDDNFIKLVADARGAQ